MPASTPGDPPMRRLCLVSCTALLAITPVHAAPVAEAIPFAPPIGKVYHLHIEERDDKSVVGQGALPGSVTTSEADVLFVARNAQGYLLRWTMTAASQTHGSGHRQPPFSMETLPAGAQLLMQLDARGQLLALTNIAQVRDRMAEAFTASQLPMPAAASQRLPAFDDAMLALDVSFAQFLRRMSDRDIETLALRLPKQWLGLGWAGMRPATLRPYAVSENLPMIGHDIAARGTLEVRAHEHGAYAIAMNAHTVPEEVRAGVESYTGAHLAALPVDKRGGIGSRLESFKNASISESLSGEVDDQTGLTRRVTITQRIDSMGMVRTRATTYRLDE